MAILFTLRIFARNLLRGNREEKIFFNIWPGARTLALRPVSQTHYQPPPFLRFWRNLVSTRTAFTRGVTTGCYERSSELCCSTSKLLLRPESEPTRPFINIKNKKPVRYRTESLNFSFNDSLHPTKEFRVPK